MNEAEIFAAAIKLSGDARHAFLDAACGQDAGHREQVEALLKAHDESGGLLPKLSDPHRDETQAILGQAVPGVVIAGRYKLLEQIGEGGMGTVWVAEQSQPVKRKVALKLIKAGMDSKSVLARFEAERQALAVMDHPNIAKVLDGGLTETGRPFFIMDYVKGIPITEYCDATKLSVPERLQLFVQVCQAVQHAHQKGIIHRDLKPSNILVAPYDDKPVPKVIDFGLAKAMNQSLTDKTLHTAHDMVLGTPQYMSPEQATFNNLDIDTRSDVYSLGTLLYELLAGSPPFAQQELEKRGLLEILRVVREEEPPRPSLKLSTAEARASISANRSSEPAQLSSMIQGEIDWIVMKALEKDRTRRYDTATALAKDVQRYLNGDAVEACPPTLVYRMRKFAKRNRNQLVAIGMVLLCLMLGIFGTTFGLIRAQQQRDEAEKARADEVVQRGIAETKRTEAEKNASEANRLFWDLQEEKIKGDIKAISLQIDLDLQELKTDPKVGLLRLAKPRPDESHGYQVSGRPIDGEGPVLNGTMIESYTDRADYRPLIEFVTAAVLSTGQNYTSLLPPIRHEGKAILSHQLSPNGETAITLDEDGTPRLWDVRTARPLAILREENEQVVTCGFSPDGNTIFTDDNASVLRLWNSDSGTLRAKTEPRINRYRSITAKNHEQVILQKSNYVAIDNATALTRAQTSPLQNDSRPSGEGYVRTGPVDLWDTNTGHHIARLDGESANVNVDTFNYACDGIWITAIENGECIVFTPKTGREVARLKSDRPIELIRHGENRIITLAEIAKNKKRLEFWDAETWNIAATITAPTFWDLQTFDDMTILGADGRHWIYAVDRPEPVSFEVPRLDDLYRRKGDTIHLSDGRLIALPTGKPIRPSPGRKYAEELIRFSFDGRFVLGGGNSSPILIDTKTEKQFKLADDGFNYQYFEGRVFGRNNKQGLPLVNVQTNNVSRTRERWY